MFGIKFGSRDVMNAESAGFYYAVNLLYSDLASVVLFQSTSGNKAAIKYGKCDCPEYGLILFIKRAIYENTVVILVCHIG